MQPTGNQILAASAYMKDLITRKFPNDLIETNAPPHLFALKEILCARMMQALTNINPAWQDGYSHSFISLLQAYAKNNKPIDLTIVDRKPSAFINEAANKAHLNPYIQALYPKDFVMRFDDHDNIIVNDRVINAVDFIDSHIRNVEEVKVQQREIEKNKTEGVSCAKLGLFGLGVGAAATAVVTAATIYGFTM